MSQITRREFVTGAALTPFAIRAPNRDAQQSSTDSTQLDIVVAGAGHNSLIAAAYLAKAGYRCVVLEDQPRIGGAAVLELLLLIHI